MRLLLVEDDPMSVDLFVASLRDDGHEIVVERGDQAVAVMWDGSSPVGP